MSYDIKIRILVFTSIFILTSLVFSSKSFAEDSGLLCDALYKTLKDKIANSNICKKDSDCDYVYLTNRKNPGCGFIGNIDNDLREVNQADIEYYKRCISETDLDNVIEECPKENKLTCHNNKCVPCIIIGKSGKCICSQNNNESCK